MSSRRGCSLSARCTWAWSCRAHTRAVDDAPADVETRRILKVEGHGVGLLVLGQQVRVVWVRDVSCAFWAGTDVGRIDALILFQAASAEGLTLITVPSTKTGYKGRRARRTPCLQPRAAIVDRSCAALDAGVSRGGKSAKKPYQAVRGQHSLGYYATAEEAALACAPPPVLPWANTAESQRHGAHSDTRAL